MIPDLRKARWRKSSRSQNGGNCVEVTAAPLTWRNSSRSTAGGNCIEVTAIHTAIAVRDSKDPTGPVLTIAPVTWTAFTTALKHDSLT